MPTAASVTLRLVWIWNVWKVIGENGDKGWHTLVWSKASGRIYHISWAQWTPKGPYQKWESKEEGEEKVVHNKWKQVGQVDTDCLWSCSWKTAKLYQFKFFLSNFKSQHTGFTLSLLDLMSIHPLFFTAFPLTNNANCLWSDRSRPGIEPRSLQWCPSALHQTVYPSSNQTSPHLPLWGKTSQVPVNCFVIRINRWVCGSWGLDPGYERAPLFLKLKSEVWFNSRYHDGS